MTALSESERELFVRRFQVHGCDLQINASFYPVFMNKPKTIAFHLPTQVELATDCIQPQEKKEPIPGGQGHTIMPFPLTRKSRPLSFPSGRQWA